MTDLYNAAWKNDLPGLRRLLQSGMDPNVRDGGSITPLMWVASLEGTEAVVILAEAGGQLDLQDDEGRTALVIAAQMNHPATVLELLVLGADPRLTDRRGRTALDNARKYNHQAVVDILHKPPVNWSQCNMTDKELDDRLRKLEKGQKYKVLLVNNNQLQSLPDLSVNKNLSTITAVNCSNNQIKRIHGLPLSVTNVHLQRNKICHLHKQCFQSENVYNVLNKALSKQQIAGLREPPPEVFTRGYEDVTQYFRDAELSDIAENASRRLVFIGETEAGKTSLMKTLIAGESVLVSIDDRTHVVDLQFWEIDDNTMYMIYDQGGHEIYAITNQLFISKHSSILIVHDISKIDEEEIMKTLNVFKRILHQAPMNDYHFVLTQIDKLDSSILNTHLEKFKKYISDAFKLEINSMKRLLEAIDQNGLNPMEISELIEIFSKKEQDILYFPVSNKTYRGITELKSFLIESISKTRVSVPKKWVKCFKAISKEDSHFIALKRFNTIFQQSYSKLRLLFTTQGNQIENANSCLKYLSDTGLVLFYEHHPGLVQHVFHKTEFLVNLFKSVFHHNLINSLNYKENTKLQALFTEPEYERVIQMYQQEGLLSVSLLQFLWQMYHLHSDDVSTIIELMKEFQLCHEVAEVDQNKDMIMFFPWFVKTNTLPNQMNPDNLMISGSKGLSFHLVCTFHNAIPQNVTEKIIVTLQKYAVQHNYLGERKAWQNGFWVKVGQMECMVVRSAKKPLVELCINADVQCLFEMWTAFHDLYRSFQIILKQFHGVLKSFLISCFHCILIGISEPNTWLPREVFPQNPTECLPFVSCKNEKGVNIPAGVITMPDPDPRKQEYQMQKVLEYLKFEHKKTQEERSRHVKSDHEEHDDDQTCDWTYISATPKVVKGKSGSTHQVTSGASNTEIDSNTVSPDSVLEHPPRGLYAHSFDHKLSKVDHENILKLMNFVCMVTTPKANLSGIFLGIIEPTASLFPQPSPSTQGPVAAILTSGHIHVHCDPNAGTAEVVFGFDEQFRAPVESFHVDGVIADNKDLDYALLLVSDSRIISKFHPFRQPLHMVTTNEPPKAKDVMILIGHPDSSHTKTDYVEVVDRQTIFQKGQFQESLMASKFDIRHGTNLHFIEHVFRIFYHCSSFSGASGGPCFRLHGSQDPELICIHAGGIFLDNTNPKHGDESDYECGVLLPYILNDISLKLSTKALQWKV